MAQESHTESESGARVGFREAVSDRSEDESFMQFVLSNAQSETLAVVFFSSVARNAVRGNMIQRAL